MESVFVKPKVYKLQAVDREEPVRLNSLLLDYFRTLELMVKDLAVTGEEVLTIELTELISAPVMQWLIDLVTILAIKRRLVTVTMNEIYETAREYNTVLILQDPDSRRLLPNRGPGAFDPRQNVDLLAEIMRAINWLESPSVMILVSRHFYILLLTMPSEQLEALALSRALPLTAKRKRTDERTGLLYTAHYLRIQWVNDYVRAVLPEDIVEQFAYSRMYANPIAAGLGHQLFITANNGLYGMGRNQAGQLGLGENQVSFEPHLFRKITTIPGRPLIVACSYNTSLCYTTEGLYGCGVNDHEQLGLGPGNELRRVWTKIEIPSEVLLMAIGKTHIMLLTVAGIYACGNNTYGQLGLGDTLNRNVFTKLPDPAYCVSLHCGDGYTVFHRKTFLLGCGTNPSFEIGQLPNPTIKPTVFYQSKTGPIVSVSCGIEHTMFVLNHTQLIANGANHFGQLGIGANLGPPLLSKNFNTPVAVLEGLPLEVHCGPNYTVCLTTTGLYATGAGEAGQLANNATNSWLFGKMIGLEGQFYGIACGYDQVFVFTSEGLYQSGRFDYVLTTPTFSGMSSLTFQKWPIDLGYRRTITILDDEDDTLLEGQPTQKKPKLDCEYCGDEARFLSEQHQLPFCNKICLYEYTEHQ